MARTKQTVKFAAAGRTALKSRGKQPAVSGKTPRKAAVKAPRMTIVKVGKKTLTKQADEPKVPKKRRFHPGTMSLMLIRRIQKTVENVIAKAPFRRLVREVAQDLDIINGGTRFTETALADIQTVTEDFGTKFFEDAVLNQVHARRKTLFKSDMDRSKSSYNRFSSGDSTLRFDVSKTEYPGRAEMLKAIAEAARLRAIAGAARRSAAGNKSKPTKAKAKPKAAPKEEPVVDDDAAEPADDDADDQDAELADAASPSQEVADEAVAADAE